MNESPAPSPQPGPAPSTRTTTYVAPRRTIRLTMPDGWARAVLAGVEAVFIAWALLACGAVGAYATVASNPWMGKASWESAFRLGSDLLGFSLGAPLNAAGVAYRAVPTLFLIIIIVILRLLLRSGRGFPASALWFAVPAFSTVAFLIVGGGSYTHWWQAYPGALGVPLIASAWAYADAKGGWKTLTGGRDWLHEGLRQGFILILVTVLLSGAALTWTLMAHAEEMKAIHALLLTGSRSADALIVAVQALYAPTWIAWALAWLTGPGVWIGIDALHSPAAISSEPIPGIPVLGAVPTSTPGMIVVLIPILVAALSGAVLGRVRKRRGLADQVRTGGVAVSLFALVLVVWLPTSVLHLGIERMSRLGPDLLPLFFALLFEIGAVFLLAEVCVHPRFIEFLRLQWRISRLGPGQTARDLAPVTPRSSALDDGARGDEGDRADADEAEKEDDLVEEARSSQALDPLPAADGDHEACDGAPAEQAGADRVRADATGDEAQAPRAKAPVPPIPVPLEEVLGEATRRIPAVKSPALQAAEGRGASTAGAPEEDDEAETRMRHDGE